ncbi:MAG: LysR family transcriptional regulator [Rhodobacteraceae bacterium]|nr:LysR family transcriptional regulator [Paracoccaceae bacterium]
MAMPKISIRALKALVAVYEEQSFSKAAERENATQSGMSTQVKNLETVLDTPLLTRNRKQFDLTPAGKIVYQEGQRVLHSLLATEQAVEELKGEISGQVRFGMIPTLTRSVMVPAMESFKHQFSGVELSLVEEYSFSLMRRVLEGELDFAFVPAGDLPNGLTAKFVGRDREMVVSRPGRFGAHAHLSPIPLAALGEARIVVPSRLNVRRRRIDTVLQAHGVHVAEMLEMDGMLGTLEMVGATDWIAILPSALCHPDKSGQARQLNVLSEPPMTIDYVMVQKAEVALSRAAAILSDVIAEHTNAVLGDWDDLGGQGSITAGEPAYSNK